MVYTNEDLNPWQFEMEHFKSQGSDAGENLNKEHQRCSVLNLHWYKLSVVSDRCKIKRFK
jgi:hypothetical protein